MVDVIVVNETVPQAVVIDEPTLVPSVVVVMTGIPGPPGDLASPEQLAVAVAPVIEIHRTAALPHPAYDDIPDFTLMYENGLV